MKWLVHVAVMREVPQPCGKMLSDSDVNSCGN